MDHADDITIPMWQPKWTLPQPNPASPTLKKKSERKGTSTAKGGSPSKKKAAATSAGEIRMEDYKIIVKELGIP